MNEWSLTTLLGSVHEKIQIELELARKSLHHPTAKGDATETVWVELLNQYLPERYCVAKAQIVDSRGEFSQQIDVVIFDRQYSHFVFNFKGQLVLPAECVYAVFEAKQTLDAEKIAYARCKAASVRRLERTSAPTFSMGVEQPGRQPPPIIAGILTLESDWNPAFGEALAKALGDGSAEDHLDVGCVATHGRFGLGPDGYETIPDGKPATGFLLDLMARLQRLGTVPAIEFDKYAAWLKPPSS